MRTGSLRKAPPTTRDVMTLHKHVVATVAFQIQSNALRKGAKSWKETHALIKRFIECIRRSGSAPIGMEPKQDFGVNFHFLTL
ncbi:uncharacterized [Tachysurus ichikawai]